MMNRRFFGKLMAGAVVVGSSGSRRLMGQAAVEGGLAASQFSVMMWTLNSHGTFEENLARVAEAGYRNVELVGEFRKWSDADWKRILARMKTLGIKVDS